MAALMFFILLNQNIVRSIKDSLIVTVIGSEVLSFIKLWVEMPMGVMFVAVYTKLCNMISTENAFRLVIICFLAFFVLFGFVLFPYRTFFHPDPRLIDSYVLAFPHLKWFVLMWGKWSLVLFYVAGDLWPIIVMTLLFWQLANKITNAEEASRFYGHFNLFGQSSLLISGSIILYFSNADSVLTSSFADGKTESVIKSLVVVIFFSGIVSLLLHRRIEKKQIKKIALVGTSPRKLKLSLSESARMVISSPYLGLICVLVISYSMTANLVEGLWMSKTRQLFPGAEDFINFQGSVLFWTGVCTVICSLLGAGIIRHLGWYWAAISTPVITMVTGGIFFFVAVSERPLSAYFAPLFPIVMIGGLQNIFAKGIKYSLFDSTKEMAYIPLDVEMKTKGKAAIDVLGGKVGITLGTLTQFVSFSLYPQATHDDIAGFLMFMYLSTCAIWLYGVTVLARQFTQANAPSSLTASESTHQPAA